MNRKLIILHGWGHDKSMWVDFTTKTSTIISTTAIDLPGFGQEPLVSTDWGVPEYAEWVKQKLEQIYQENDTFILLGHSFGGRIASLIASQQPEWLHSLILYGTPSLYRPDAQTRLKIKTYKTLKHIVPKGIKERFQSQDLVESREQGMEQVFRNVVNFDQTQELPKIQVPTLLLWGENDEAVPLRIAQEMDTLIPNSGLAAMPNLGHNAHLENPNLFYGIVKSFLENS